MARDGFGFGLPHRLVGDPPASVAFTPPVLTKTSASTVNPPEWDSDFTSYLTWDSATSTGDKHLMQWRRVNGGAWTTEVEQPLDDEILTGGFTWPLFEAAKPLAGGYFEAQEQRVRYIAGVETLRSPWSNSVTDTALVTIFAPAAVSGIKDYYRVRTAKLWKDTAGTIAVTADGDAVARWDSELGTMAPWLQATAISRPIYRANSGNPYLEFNGSNSNMAVASTGISAVAQPYYIAIATKLSSLGNRQLIDSATGSNRVIMQSLPGPDNWQSYAGISVTSQGLTPTTNDAVYTGLFNGASSNGRLDGVNGTTVNIGTNAPISGLTLGSNNTGTGGWLTGRIYGFVLVAASPSSGDKASLDTWLGALQGRTL